MTPEVPPDANAARPAGSRWILYGIAGAIVVGALLGGLAPPVGSGLRVLGEVFLNALMMIVVPLIITSMIVGVTALGDVRELGPLGWRTVAYYLATTGMAVVVGIILVTAIRPGVGVPRGEEVPDAAYRIDGNTVYLLRGELQRTSYGANFVVRLPDQDAEAAITQASPTEVTVAGWADAAGGPVTPEREGRGLAITLPVAEQVKGKERGVGAVVREVVVGLVPSNLFAAMAEGQILPLIIFSLLFGSVLTTLGERGRPAVRFFQAANDAVMRIVHLIMCAAPIGIMGLIAARIGDAGGFVGFAPELSALGKYFSVVVIGLAIHGVVTLPAILRLVGRRRATTYAGNVTPALLNAFSTASSSATLPLTMECVEQRNGISNRTASFVLPLGATVNMDGTALYEAVAAVFVAQVFGIELGTAALVIVFLTATLAAIGAAGIPEAGLVTMVIVLTAVALPVEGISLILTIDWLLDRFRTTVNVWGDSVGAAVVDALEQRDEVRSAGG